MNELKLPTVWAAEKHLRVVDPDGWRGPPVKHWRVEITEEEFDERVLTSTIELLPGHPQRTPQSDSADDMRDWPVQRAVKL